MMLKDKVAVIYGAGGAIGGAVARAFAARAPGSFSPGASWHPSKRRQGRRSAEAAEVDALDEQAVDEHLRP